MTNVEALKALYAALGGDADDVENASTIVEVLNAIAAKYDGADDAIINPDAIANITEVVGSIVPPTPETFEVDFNFNGMSSTLTATKTYDEIIAACYAGKQITGTMILKTLATWTMGIVSWAAATDKDGNEGVIITAWESENKPSSEAGILFLFNNRVRIVSAEGEAYNLPITPA